MGTAESDRVISDPGMIYFDVRPSSHVPTIELRVCDACHSVDTVVLIAGLFRALVEREVEGLRTAVRDIQAVLPGPGCDFEHPRAPEGDGRQTERSIQAVTAFEVCPQVLRLIEDRRDAVRLVIFEMSAGRRAPCAGHGSASFPMKRDGLSNFRQFQPASFAVCYIAIRLHFQAPTRY